MESITDGVFYKILVAKARTVGLTENEEKILFQYKVSLADAKGGKGPTRVHLQHEDYQDQSIDTFLDDE